MSDHQLGFAEFGAGDADGSGLELKTGDLRGFVGFGVGAPVGSMDSAELSEIRHVGFENIQVHQENGGIQFFFGLAQKCVVGISHLYKN